MFGTWAHEGKESCAKASPFVVNIYTMNFVYYFFKLAVICIYIQKGSIEEFELVFYYFFSTCFGFNCLIRYILEIHVIYTGTSCYSIHPLVKIF